MKLGEAVEFELQDQDGKPVNASHFHGKPVVLFFYPRADTPGCTVEACEFRDLHKELQQAGAVVLGISRDTVSKQKKFAEKFSLGYPLLADAELTVAKKFDVVREGSMYGKPVTKVERSTFVIGKDGKLAAEFRGVKPEGHAAEMLAAVQRMA